MIAVPQDVVEADAVVAVGAILAIVREGEATGECVILPVVGGTKGSARHGLGAEEDDGGAETTAVPVEDHDFARHVGTRWCEREGMMEWCGLEFGCLAGALVGLCVEDFTVDYYIENNEKSGFQNFGGKGSGLKGFFHCNTRSNNSKRTKKPSTRKANNEPKERSKKNKQ